MKTFFALLTLLILTGCHKTQIEPEEVKATLLSYQPVGYVCDGGYVIKPETKAVYMARTTNLPAPYNDFNTLKLPASVWIRFKNSTDPIYNCGQPPVIEFVSIRAR